jgi:hypothetical protein
LLVCVAAAAPFGAARAAMNFCAAPALQSSERTNAAPAIETLMRQVAGKLGDAPNPLAGLSTEKSRYQGADDKRVEGNQDLDLMRDAALVWRATGDQRYLRLVDRFLFAWATTYQPTYNPIDETHLDSLIIAYDLTASALPVKTRNATTAFIATLANGYVERIDAEPRPLKGTFRDKGQSHRVKLIAMSAFTLDDRKLINTAQRLFVEQIGNNVLPDGATVDFAERGVLHDVTEDLEPLVVAALAARRHNRNWLNERGKDGASLALALDWLQPYALGEKTQKEFVQASEPVPRDVTRRETSAPDVSSQWDPQDSAELFHLAARLSGRYAPTALRVSPTPPDWLAVCLPLPAR